MTKSEDLDIVNHPPHYKREGVPECIDLIEALELPYHLGNVLKYIYRAGKKGPPLEDLKKAQWYLSRFIEQRQAYEEQTEGKVFAETDNVEDKEDFLFIDGALVDFDTWYRYCSWSFSSRTEAREYYDKALKAERTAQDNNSRGSRDEEALRDSGGGSSESEV